MGRRFSLVLTIFALLSVSLSADGGSVSGKIVFDDKIPRLRPLRIESDPACAAKHDGRVYPDFLILGEDNALANVLIQVRNPPPGNYQAPEEAIVIDQVGCVYTPRVVAVMTGQELLFRNSDGILHNVHGLPKANREFNIGMPPTVAESSQRLVEPEPAFPVRCDVHPWMEAYVAVLSHPFFSISGEDGRYEIDDLPPGTYELAAWHEKLGIHTTTVTVEEGEATADFTLRVPK
ncbi:MAG: carboxypeptidase regulatory-like domain-containing protein [Acidobacteriota bacterium]